MSLHGVCGRGVCALGYGVRGRGFESRRWHMLCRLASTRFCVPWMKWSLSRVIIHCKASWAAEKAGKAYYDYYYDDYYYDRQGVSNSRNMIIVNSQSKKLFMKIAVRISPTDIIILCILVWVYLRAVSPVHLFSIQKFYHLNLYGKKSETYPFFLFMRDMALQLVSSVSSHQDDSFDTQVYWNLLINKFLKIMKIACF